MRPEWRRAAVPAQVSSLRISSTGPITRGRTDPFSAPEEAECHANHEVRENEPDKPLVSKQPATRSFKRGFRVSRYRQALPVASEIIGELGRAGVAVAELSDD